jgi:hypothetical protein
MQQLLSSEVTLEFLAPGRQVLIKVKGFPKEATQHFVAAVEGFASNLGHVNVTWQKSVQLPTCFVLPLVLA